MATHKGLLAQHERSQPRAGHGGCGRGKAGAVRAREEPLETIPWTEHHITGDAGPAGWYSPGREGCGKKLPQPAKAGAEGLALPPPFVLLVSLRGLVPVNL